MLSLYNNCAAEYEYEVWYIMCTMHAYIYRLSPFPMHVQWSWLVRLTPLKDL